MGLGCLGRGMCALLLLVLLPGWSAGAEDASLNWPPAASTTRPWAYWWWMASAVDEPNLSRELKRYHDAGLGGVHIIPIYGAKGFEDRYIEYLSPKWMQMLRFTVSEAQRLGMGVDMSTGTGWCFGGPNVPANHAGMRAEIKKYPVAAGQRLAAKLDPKSLVALMAFGGGKRIDLAARVQASGELDWVAPEGEWTVYAVSGVYPRRMVKRPAPGGEGLMLNPLYGQAMRNYLERFTAAFASYDGPKPRAMYQDSYEYSSEWSPDFLTEFAKRRGYRLEDELPALAGGTDDRAARVKCDYRETVSDLMVENATPAWVNWSHQQGFITRNEAHGSPGNLLDLYAAADIPETEMFNRDREVLVAKFASSASHVAGRRLCSSETATWLAEHFTETLGQLKLAVDELFVSGINHVFYHGMCYSPDDAPWPGWLFYASTEMNPRNAIWHDVPAFNGYISRCQSILQSGQPDNDILLYWPIHDLWHNPAGMAQGLTVHSRDWLNKQPVGAAARQLWNRGFTFDYISDRQLASAAAKDGQVQVSGGRYRAIVVPTCRHMPVGTMQRLLALAQGRATVIFQDSLPQDVPGLGNLDERRAALRKLLAGIALSDADQIKLAKVGAGRIVAGELEPALLAAGVRRESMADAGLLFVRRREPFGWHYFLANQGTKQAGGWMSLAVKARSVVVMDPMTGRTGAATCVPTDGGTDVHVQLQPGESVILRAFADRVVAGPKWQYWQPAGRPVELRGTWRVQFIEGGPELPPAQQMDRLVSWTAAGEAAQRFAGTARYTITFDRPKANATKFILDLGKVCQSARVRLNGRDLGTLLLPPFTVNVDEMKATGNVLEIEVTSTSANRIRDLDRRGIHWKNFRDINIVNIDYKPFDASNWPVYDCGLLGPVTVTPAAPVLAARPR